MRWSAVFALVSVWSWGADLQFQYLDGDRFGYRGEGTQSVLLNGKPLQTNTSESRSQATVSAVFGAELSVETACTVNSKGARSISQNSSVQQAKYVVDARGAYSVPENARLPVVRGVPTFPGRDLAAGQTWAAQGSEVVDVSQVAEFSRNKTELPPIELAFSAAYTYKGAQPRNGRTLDVIEGEYDIAHKPEFGAGSYRVYPVLFSGKTRVTVYFDNALGLVESSTENYVLDVVLSTGDIYEFTGTTTAELEDAALKERPPRTDQDAGPGSWAALKSAPSISFQPDSAVLTPDEQENLRRLAQTLSDYAGDLLIAGFTAKAGTKQQQNALSQARAAAVEAFLVEQGFPAGRMVAVGLGTRKAGRRALVFLVER